MKYKIDLASVIDKYSLTTVFFLLFIIFFSFFKLKARSIFTMQRILRQLLYYFIINERILYENSLNIAFL